MISALARAVVYTPPHQVCTSNEVINSKKKMGEEAFAEECARIEFAIKEAACESPNYGAIIDSLLITGTDTEALSASCHMRVGIPLKPMLAKPTKGVQIILKRFEGIDFTCEYKYDGFRGQIHFWREDEKPIVKIYSRNLENMTVAYPDVTSFLSDNVP
jgi:DNA ligase-1